MIKPISFAIFLLWFSDWFLMCVASSSPFNILWMYSCGVFRLWEQREQSRSRWFSKASRQLSSILPGYRCRFFCWCENTIEIRIEEGTCSFEVDLQSKPDREGHQAVHGDDKSGLRGGWPRSTSRDAFRSTSSEPHHAGYFHFLLLLYTVPRWEQSLHSSCSLSTLHLVIIFFQLI